VSLFIVAWTRDPKALTRLPHPCRALSDRVGDGWPETRNLKLETLSPGCSIVFAHSKGWVRGSSNRHHNPRSDRWLACPPEQSSAPKPAAKRRTRMQPTASAVGTDAPPDKPRRGARDEPKTEDLPAW